MVSWLFPVGNNAPQLEPAISKKSISTGARIAKSDREGVVDGRGEVYNNPGIFITDGSVFPSAIGAPPTLSIAAWSSYVASKITEEINTQ